MKWIYLSKNIIHGAQNLIFNHNPSGAEKLRNILKEVEFMKCKTVWAYLDGKKLVDVVQAALDNNMMVSDLKKKLIEENPNHEVTFKIQ